LEPGGIALSKRPLAFPRMSLPRQAQSTPAIAERSRALVIDDERDVLDTVAAILEVDFIVETCGSAVVARKLLAKDTFDVVCTDYQMPTMTGIELLADIPSSGIVVGAVITTGRYEACAADLATRPQLQAALPITVLRKPYAPQDLIDAVRRASSFARVRRALRGLQRPAVRP
jgi:two-component system, sensor histidine kinase ChiS